MAIISTTAKNIVYDDSDGTQISITLNANDYIFFRMLERIIKAIEGIQ